MRSKKLRWNIASAMSYQVFTIFCGFLVPRFLLESYGSAVNGLVNSISQFLGLITYLDCGIGAVLQTALYEPLAAQDDQRVSGMLRSGRRFYRKIAGVLVVYVAALILLYPVAVDSSFDRAFSGSLIAVMSITAFAQYYWGMTDQLLLAADQRLYITNTVQIITLLANTGACILLMRQGFSIQTVKLATSVIFLAKPLLFRFYVNQYHTIDRTPSCREEPLTQKWNGLAQHIAAVVIGGTDTVVLSLFSTLENVSVYGVYFLVINGLEKLFVSASSGFRSYFGDLWAKQELAQLRTAFDSLAWAIHTGVVFVFGCASVLLVPFVSVYTAGITDVNYTVPEFALLITLAYGFYCLRLPYDTMVLAGYHYKQTQWSYLVAAALNLSISIFLVQKLGLVGVAIGTLVSMAYQTVWLAWYNSKNLVVYPFSDFLRQLALDILSFSIAYGLTKDVQLMTLNYGAWLILAAKTALLWASVLGAVNLIFRRKQICALAKALAIRKKH